MAKAAKKTKIKVVKTESIIENTAKFLCQFVESETLARRVLKKNFDENNIEKVCLGVLRTALAHYCVVVLDGKNILEQKLKEQNADALFILCNAQYKK